MTTLTLSRSRNLVICCLNISIISPQVVLRLGTITPAVAREAISIIFLKLGYVYHASVPAAGGACDVQATLTENWLVYHYFDDEPPAVGQSKGYRVISVEFYEGNGPDDKIRRSVSAFDW
jgi:hypothetical protein